MGKDIPVSEEHNIAVRQPRISEVVDMGEEKLNQVILPFILNTDIIFGNSDKEEELNAQFDIFDLFFVETEDGKMLLDNILGERTIDALVESLKYFLDVEEVRVLSKRKKIVINNAYLIDAEQFRIIRKVVQEVMNRKEIEVEKPPKNMSERQRDIWIKLQRGRKRSAEKNALHLQDIINYTSFGGSYYISFNEIENMTYYQLQNAYKSVIGKDSFDIGMGYKLSQKFDVKDEIKHWTDSLKIGK